MPHIIISNAKSEEVISFSKDSLDTLSNIFGCDKDWFTFENNTNQYLYNGNKLEDSLFICIRCFKREDSVYQKLNEYIKHYFSNYGLVTVYYEHLSNDYYFEFE